MSNGPFILGIDATNISGGGGLLHLIRILESAILSEGKFQKIIVWSSLGTLNKLPDSPLIIKQGHPWLDRHIGWRLLWRILRSRSQINLFKCDSVFSPGSMPLPNAGVPIINLAQNLLPFDMKEVLRFGLSFYTVKLLLLRIGQILALRTSKANIFLTDFSKKKIEEVLKKNTINSVIIPHGVDERFVNKIKNQKGISSYSEAKPFRFLYVSPLWPYKNHDNVIFAISLLRKEGYWVQLDIIGGVSHNPSFIKMCDAINMVDIKKEYIFYHGSLPYDELIVHYQEADLFIFASSCESFGQIVTEAMASGLPIACSGVSSMQELLRDGSLYFDPLDRNSIYCELKKLINSPSLRAEIAFISSQYASKYSWRGAEMKH